MTEQDKAYIDGLTYIEMFRRWRFSTSGDSLFQGDTGEYFNQVMAVERERIGEAEHTRISKAIGWD